MAKSSRQKIKLLILLKTFLEKTDEQHPLSVKALIQILEEYGVFVERKTIYDDIETLRTFGLDIVNRRQKPTGYYVASRTFELPELKLLVDAVQSSRFITQKKSNELIKKIEGLTSVYEARSLQRQVTVDNGVKAVNESVFYNIDEIHTALSEEKQITFQYYEWTLAKEMQLKKDGARYRISPWGLIWKDENYYVIALDEKSGVVKHYRVDKMLKINVEPEPRNGKEIFGDFNVAQFAARTFGMFGGREETLTMEFENHFVGVVIDHFGQDVTMYKRDEEHFTAVVHVNVSHQFFGWLTGLGAGAKIVSPIHVQKEYVRFLKNAMECYKK